MNLIEKTAQKLLEITKNRPMFLHMDAIGFLPYGENKGTNIQEIINNKLKAFNDALVLAEDMGANILIPVFSYSIIDGKLNFDIKNSPSQVGAATEFLRKLNLQRRTKDPIFSYLLFSKNKELRKDLEVQTFNTFGENSIIDKVFNMEGFIGSIGNVLWHPTEAHYLEKKMRVSYRYDKVFRGQIIDFDNKKFDIESVFFCRDLSYNKIADFKPLEQEMYNLNMVQEIKIDNFILEYVNMKDMFELMQRKYKENKFYFCKNEQHEYKINI